MPIRSYVPGSVHPRQQSGATGRAQKRYRDGNLQRNSVEKNIQGLEEKGTERNDRQNRVNTKTAVVGKEMNGELSG